MRRQTKIVATMGPAVASLGHVAELIHAGLDVARLNFSHGGHDTHRQFAGWVREAASDAGANVALLQDIQGPKLRLGTLPDGKVQLDRGEQVDLVPGAKSGDRSNIPVDYEHLLEDVAPGGSVLVADGLVRLEVAERLEDRLRCVVVAGGELADHKGVAFPGSSLRVPPLTDKDAADIAFGRELGVDYVAMSFVRSSEDIRQVAALVEPGTPIIAKVELAAAYENLDDIMAAADGVMVARGDLGVELPLERIPMVQADILERANAAGLLTITATEMLQSMVEAPRPTRAEVTDVATAVTEGTDAVMLSGETAVGKYPVEAVRMMDTICREVETGLRPQRRSAHLTLSSVPTFASAIAKAAVEAAVDLDLSTIVAFTETGSTARLLSKYRPASDIVAFTAREATLRRMALYWGVRAVPFERRAYTDLEIAAAEKYLEKERLCTRGEGVVMVAGIPANRQASTNLMKLHVIGDRDRGVPSQRDGRSAGGLSGPV